MFNVLSFKFTVQSPMPRRQRVSSQGERPNLKRKT